MSTSPISPMVTSGGSTIPGATVAGANSSVGANAAAASSGSGSSAQVGLGSDFTTFLNLLTTQLQNQDPTSPVSSSQFTQQLVEFSGVQQQVQTNTLLQQLVTATQGNQVASASSYIGTTIQATGDQIGLSSSGTGFFGYNLATAAANATVTITDSSGNTVYVGSGPVAAGSNTVEWNGTNSFTGATEPAGTYTVNVTATDANGNAITATPFETGVVSSASISNGTVMLNVGGLLIPESSITNITNLPGTPTATSSGSGSSLGSSLSSALNSIL